MIKKPFLKDNKEWKKLGQQLGLSPKGITLLRQALTHPTYFEGDKHNSNQDNQRLEFLGDAVLDLLIGEYLFDLYPDLREGELTKMRAAVVCESFLAKKSEELGIDKALRLGKGSEVGGDRSRPSVLADAFEAVLGSIYKTEGIEFARNFIGEHFAESLKHLSRENYEDKKSVLQEMIQKRGAGNIHYHVLDTSGPEHAKVFTSGVYWGSLLLGKGEGNSKKESEQEAAKVALKNKDKWFKKIKVKSKYKKKNSIFKKNNRVIVNSNAQANESVMEDGNGTKHPNQNFHTGKAEIISLTNNINSVDGKNGLE